MFYVQGLHGYYWQFMISENLANNFHWFDDFGYEHTITHEKPMYGSGEI